MTVYREFVTNEKSMEELVKEIIKRYIMREYYNLSQRREDYYVLGIQ